MLLHDMLGRGVKLFGEIPAVVDGDVRLTYNQLSGRVHKLAAALQNLGLEHGDHVAIFANNGFRYMEAYLAVSVAGVVLAPINTRLSAGETEFILNDGEIKALLIDAEFLPLLEEMRENLKTIERIIVLDGEPQGDRLGYEALVKQADPERIRPRDWAEDDMVLLCYTGGTTGLPKGSCSASGTSPPTPSTPSSSPNSTSGTSGCTYVPCFTWPTCGPAILSRPWGHSTFLRISSIRAAPWN